MAGRRHEAGQALFEHLVFTGFGVLVMLGLFQLYLTNWTIQRSISAAHGVLFRKAFTYNCANGHAPDACTYDNDTRGKVVWSPRVLPEVEIPTLEVFARGGIVEPTRLWSNSPLNRRSGCSGGLDCLDDAFERCQGRPCKRTKLGVGTWMPLDDALRIAGVHAPPLARPLLAAK